MKLLAQWLGRSIVAVVIILFSANRPALADTYTVYDLGDDNSHGIYGIDAVGQVVIWSTSGCGSSSYCYMTYVNGVASTDGGTPPILEYDNGASCNSSIEGFLASKEACNSGFTAFGSLYNPNGDPNGVYIDSGSGTDFLHSGSADQLFLNSAGDLAWIDGRDEEIFVAIRNTTPVFEARSLFVQQDSAPEASTPEPGSLLLIATGVLGFTAAIRRKAHR